MQWNKSQIGVAMIETENDVNWFRKWHSLQEQAVRFILRFLILGHSLKSENIFECVVGNN